MPFLSRKNIFILILITLLTLISSQTLALGVDTESLKEPKVYSTLLGVTASSFYIYEEKCILARDTEGNIYTCGNGYAVIDPDCPVYTYNTTDRRPITITKFDPTGGKTIYSILLGTGLAYGFTVDSEGNTYVAGNADSKTFPVTMNAFDTVYQSCEGFITKISPDGSHLVFSTLLGGSSLDHIKALVVDTANRIYVVGKTNSYDFPITEGVYQTQRSIYGDAEGFITCLSPDGSHLEFSTYLGGTQNDIITGIALDSVQNIFITGYSSSTDFPLTPTAFDTPQFNEQYYQYDIFVSKLSPDARDLLYSTMIGGENTDESSSIGIDTAGNMFITGYTRSIDYPVTDKKITTQRDNMNAFITCLSAQGDHLIYSYVIDSTFESMGNDIKVDNHGNAFVCGYTYGHDLPITKGAYDIYSEASSGLIYKTDGFGFLLDSFGRFLYATFLGGDEVTSPESILLIDTNDIWILGLTSSKEFPTSLECKTIKNNNDLNQFLIKLKPEAFPGPAFPNNLKATATNCSTIQLNWVDAADNEEGFKIFALKENGGWTQIGQTGSNISQYTDKGLPELTTRNYRIYAYNSSYQSFWSNIAYTKTFKAPLLVNNFSLETGYRQVRVSWTNSTVPEYVATRIMKKEGSPSNSTTDGVLIYEGNGTYCVDSNLANGITYYYTAYLRDTSQYYEEGTSLSVTLSPAPVNQFTAMPKGTSVILSWNNPRQEDYLATLVVRRGDRYPDSPTDGEVVYWYNGNSCEDKNKVLGQTYYYAAYAHDTQNIFAPSAKDQITLGDTIPPDSVTVLSVLPGDQKVNLAWTPPDDIDYVSTLICRRDDRYSFYPGDGDVAYWYNGTQYTDQPLVNGKTYYYTFYAQDKNMNFSSGWKESVYLDSWQNRLSDFDVAADTSNWAYEPAEGITGIPGVSWNSLYAEHTGLMIISFSGETEGIKMTGLGRVNSNYSTGWVNLKITFREDSTNDNLEILPAGLFFSNPTSWELRGVGASWTGENQSLKGSWHTWETWMESRNYLTQPQLILKNNGHPGTLYIDSVELNHIPAPAFSIATSYSYEYGDFSPAEDTVQWGFETLDETTGGMPEISIINTNDHRSYDALLLTFTGPNQGLKMTSKTLFDTQPSAPLYLYYMAKTTVEDTTNFGLDIGGFLYSEDSSNPELYEIGGRYDIGFSYAGWEERKFYLNPLAGHTQGRIQMIIRNHDYYPFRVLLDNISFHSLAEN